MSTKNKTKNNKTKQNVYKNKKNTQQNVYKNKKIQDKCLQNNSVLTWKYYYAHLSENSVYNWSVH